MNAMKCMLATAVVAMVVATVCDVALSQTLPQNVPLPADLKVVVPDASLPPDVKQFSGRWVGSWSDPGLDHVLVVEEISSPDHVTAVYAYGTNQYVPKAGFTRVRGKIDARKLTFTLRNGAVVTYVLALDGELKGEYERPGAIVRATMKRVRE
jgi:hypothetical protein